MNVCRGFALLSRGVRDVSRCQVLRTRPFPSCACAITQTYRHVADTTTPESVQPAVSQTNNRHIKKLISTTDEPDVLYKKIEVLAKGHDKTVLDSYEHFTVLAAKELGICVEGHEPQKKKEKFTVLKSVHIFKKHRVQYEMRTHYRCLEKKHLTGSTANVYLEYIQRNVPEGVALEITKVSIDVLNEQNCQN
ncbi:unnamed protein product [Staurois parvus]|uniref:Small ribosomal subunit protein uS10m n=1 Tax=Staurois parvus TaxID=386267 RepID=A0ABN9F6W8_9NEOB|nr:unnamed protein product [Staurois parvus]